MEIGWIMGGLFVVMMVIYFVLAVLFPELVGIQGKKAREIENTHREDKQEDSTH